MSITPTGPPYDQLLATAETVADERPEVDLEMAREVFAEAATLLHNGLVLDELDERRSETPGTCTTPRPWLRPTW